MKNVISLFSLLFVLVSGSSVMAQTSVVTPEAEATARQLMAEALDSDLA